MNILYGIRLIACRKMLSGQKR